MPPPTTDPIEPNAPQTAPRLTIAPSWTDPATGQVYVHQDLSERVPNWSVEEHIGPIARTEKLGDIDSWCRYVQRFGGGPTSADELLLTWSERGLVAVLDYFGEDGEPALCQWIARCDFELSGPWKRWTTLANGRPRGQRDILEAIEDLSEDIVAPLPADLLAILRTLRATASATADTELLPDGSTRAVWSKSTGVRAGELEIPPTFEIAIPALHGDTTPNAEGKLVPLLYSLTVRVRANVDDAAHLAFRLSLPGAERVLEAALLDRVDAARALLGESQGDSQGGAVNVDDATPTRAANCERVPPSRCLACATPIPYATARHDGDVPTPGDSVSVCYRCGALAMFDVDLTLRRPTPTEAFELSANFEVQAVVAAVRRAASRRAGGTEGPPQEGRRMADDDAKQILVTTLVAARDRSGRVQVEGPGVKLQLSVQEAQDLAANILQAASYAEADAFLFFFVRQTIGADDAGAAGLLSEFRQYREARVARPLEGTPAPTPGTPWTGPTVPSPVVTLCLKCAKPLEDGNDGPLCMLCLWPGRTS